MNKTYIDNDKEILHLWNVKSKKYTHLPFQTINDLYKIINNIPPFTGAEYRKNLLRKSV